MKREEQEADVWNDVYRVVLNTGIVYVGCAAILSFDEHRGFAESLTADETIFYTSLFGSSYALYRMGRRHGRWISRRYFGRDREE
ncbi:MAG: hypothetical protein AABX73_03615 [Nanoarchaeota archaeon]